MATITLTKADGTTDVVYTEVSRQGLQVNYQNIPAGLNEPETMRVQHWMRPLGAKGSDRHNVVLQKIIVEDTTNLTLVGSLSVMVSIPRSSEFTLAMFKDMVAQMTSYLNRTANITSLYNGGTPEGDFNVTGPFNPTLA